MAVKHGHARKGSKSRTYSCWEHMIARCTCPTHQSWAHYGGRGINVTTRWRSYENFLADMGEAPAGLTLDRIDNDGDYEASNCRWVPQKVQVRNQRRNKLNAQKIVEIKSLRSSGFSPGYLAEWYGVHRHTIYSALNGKSWC